MRRTRRFQTAFRLALALLALLGQSAIACVSAAGDEAGAAAHVEQSGIALHHAHNEATCVVCRVLSLHGRAPAQAAAPPPFIVERTGPESVPAPRPEQHHLPNNLSRAPPENA